MREGTAAHAKLQNILESRKMLEGVTGPRGPRKLPLVKHRGSAQGR